MFRIAICDDMRVERQTVENELTRYLSERGLTDQFMVDVYSEPQALLRKCSTGHYDLFLLDVLMPNITGIETARELHEMLPDAQFIFITTTSEFLMDAFSVKALYYLLKPYSSADFDQAMDRAKNYFITEAGDFISLNGGGEEIRIEVHEIVYAHAEGRKVKLVTKNGTRTLSGYNGESIAEVLCGNAFVRAGSYIINVENIRRMKDGVLTFCNGETAGFTKDIFQNIREKFISFYDE